jgi:hypothetical protein
VTTATANSYTLPPFTTVAGTWQVYVLCEDATLTDPTENTILEIGERRESADIIAGISEIANLRIRVRDDYSDATHDEGFWYAALQGECWVRIDLNEGSNTCYFFGMVDKENRNAVRWSEHYLGASSRIRTAEIELVSMSRKVFDTDLDTWISDVLTNSSATGHTPSTNGEASHVIKVIDLFDCFLKASGLHADFNPALDVSYICGSRQDMYWGDGVSDYHFDDIYIPTKYFKTIVPEVIEALQFFDTSGANCLSVQSDGTGYYSSADAIIKDLLHTFGVQMVMGYDVSTNRHTMTFMNKSQAYSATVTFESREKSSEILQAIRFVADAVRTTQLVDESKYRWQSLKYCKYGSTAEPDARVGFDIDSKAVFVIDATANGVANCSILSWAGSGNAANYMTGCNYYELSNPVVQTAATQEEACTAYIYYFLTVERRTIVRRYSHLQAYSGGAWAQTNIGLLRRTEIDDLVSTVTYYANSVTKDASNSELEVEWVEEP